MHLALPDHTFAKVLGMQQMLSERGEILDKHAPRRKNYER